MNKLISRKIKKAQSGMPIQNALLKLHSKTNIQGPDETLIQHGSIENLNGGNNWSGVIGNTEYFIRKNDRTGKYMYNVNDGQNVIFENENATQVPLEVRNYLTDLHNKQYLSNK